MSLLGFIAKTWVAGEKLMAADLNNAIIPSVNGAVTPSAGYLTGLTTPSATSVFDTLYAGANNAKIKIDVDGVVYDNVPVTLQASNTTTTIAAAVQSAIRAVTGGLETCVYSTNKYVITSGTVGQASQVLRLMTPSTGTDISGNNATKYLDCGSGATQIAGTGHSTNRGAWLLGGQTPSALAVFQTLANGANDGKIKANIDGVIYDNLAVNLKIEAGTPAAVITQGVYNTPSSLNAGQIAYQSITTASNQYSISAVAVYFGAIGGSTSVTCNLKSGAVFGAGTVLATKAITPVQSVPNTFTFDSVVPVNPSTQYHFEIVVNNGTGFSVMYQNTNVYAGGSCKIVTTDYPTYDLYFVISGGIGVAPTTTASVALALQAAIRAVTGKTEVVTYNTGMGCYYLRSSLSITPSSVLKLMTPATGTDLSGVGATKYFDLGTNAQEIAMYSDYGKVVELNEYGVVNSDFMSPLISVVTKTDYTVVTIPDGCNKIIITAKFSGNAYTTHFYSGEGTIDRWKLTAEIGGMAYAASTGWGVILFTANFLNKTITPSTLLGYPTNMTLKYYFYY